MTVQTLTNINIKQTENVLKKILDCISDLTERIYS